METTPFTIVQFTDEQLRLHNKKLMKRFAIYTVAKVVIFTGIVAGAGILAKKLDKESEDTIE